MRGSASRVIEGFRSNTTLYTASGLMELPLRLIRTWERCYSRYVTARTPGELLMWRSWLLLLGWLSVAIVARSGKSQGQAKRLAHGKASEPCPIVRIVVLG